MKGNRILVGREVKEALNTGAPVVAMETGFLSHREGNRNHVADALQIMNTVRAHDAVPAVVAVDDGKMLVGMTEEELARFLEQPDLIKCNQRDVCVAVERRLHGATTISATLHAASLLGICIVASGGIGGGSQRGSDILRYFTGPQQHFTLSRVDSLFRGKDYTGYSKNSGMYRDEGHYRCRLSDRLFSFVLFQGQRDPAGTYLQNT